ncbi:G-protein coupled receptor 157-like [Mytilus edulis]|uniref:G-protein coupled receptor 157-like n=1 Tax=Mytilus edulis TaxID=6550 RepID=UPI0039F147C3
MATFTSSTPFANYTTMIITNLTSTVGPIPVIPATYKPIEGGDIALTLIASTLSIFGAILIFVAYCVTDSFRPENETRRLLIYLTVSDLLVAFGNFGGTIRYKAVFGDKEFSLNCTMDTQCDLFCVVQSFVCATASMWSFFWNTVIAIHICVALVYCRHGSWPWKMKIFTHSVCWLVPLSITIAAVSNDVLGEDFSQGTGAWCWISSCIDKNARTLWMVVTGKGWEITWYFVTCIMFFFVKGYMWKQRRRHNIRHFSEVSERLRAEDENYLYLWLIGYCLRIWGTCRFFLYALRRHTGNPLSHFNSTDDVFLHLQSFGDSAQAFCTCILFCFIDRTTRHHLYKKLCCKKSDEEELRPIITEKTNINYSV